MTRSVSNFVNELTEKGIKLTFSKGKLLYSGPEEYINDELINKLKEHKAHLLKYYWPVECYNMMPVHTSGNKIPFTFIHAGKAIYTLQQYLGDDQPLYGFFDEGSEGKKIRFKNVESFASEYLRQIQTIIPTDPYILGGLSFGGIIAFEIALQLQNQGLNVPYLVLGDCEIPKYRRMGERGSKIYVSLKNIYRFIKNIYIELYQSTRNIIYWLFTFLNIDLPLNYRKSYIIWTYYKLAKKYNPPARYHGKILLFKSDMNNSPNKYLGWDKLCDNVTIKHLAGNHHSMYESEKTIKILGEKISQFLQKANKGK